MTPIANAAPTSAPAAAPPSLIAWTGSSRRSCLMVTIPPPLSRPTGLAVGLALKAALPGAHAPGLAPRPSLRRPVVPPLREASGAAPWTRQVYGRADPSNGSGTHSPVLPALSYCERRVRAMHDGRDGRRRDSHRHEKLARAPQLPLAHAAPHARDHRRAARRGPARRQHAVRVDASPGVRLPGGRAPRTRRGRGPLTTLPSALALAAAAVLLAGCGDGTRGSGASPSPGPPIGVGPTAAYTPPPRGVRAAAGASIGGLRCATGDARRVGAHVELFAHRHVVVVAAGIGMAPPVRTPRAYVTAARCSYPVRTCEPTGLLELEPSARALTLGELFAIWGQPLSTSRLAGFHAPPGTRVAAYLDGRPWPGDPRAVPLRRHAVIVLEVAGHVPPPSRYRFPRGL